MKTAINTVSASPLADSMVQYKALERGEAGAEHPPPMPLVLQDGDHVSSSRVTQTEAIRGWRAVSNS